MRAWLGRLWRRIRKQRWLSVMVETESGARGVDVVPLDDLIVHELGDRCVCGPSVELQRDEDGADWWIHVHASLDGREAQEHADA